MWRGGRVVEGGGLENRYLGTPRIVGSNPTLSAICSLLPLFGLLMDPFVTQYLMFSLQTKSKAIFLV